MNQLPSSVSPFLLFNVVSVALGHERWLGAILVTTSGVAAPSMTTFARRITHPGLLSSMLFSVLHPPAVMT